MQTNILQSLIYFVWIIVQSAEGENIIHACLNEYVSLECSASNDCTIDIQQAEYGYINKAVIPANCSSQRIVCYTNATDVWYTCHRQVACSFHVRQERATTGKCTQHPSNQLVLNYKCRCPASCFELPDLAYGYTEYDSPYLTRGAQARFYCNPGYELVGSSTRTCQDSGDWSGIQPACSAPLRVCPTSSFGVSAYGRKCFELVEKSRNWTSASEDCRMKNGTLSDFSSMEEYEYIRWWLDDSGLFGYVWIGARGASDSGMFSILPYQVPRNMCPEFYRNESEDQAGNKWQVRVRSCSFLNRYICQYDVYFHFNATQRENEFMLVSKHDLAIGLGVGVGVLLVAILLPVIIVCCLRRRRLRKEIDPYATVMDPSPRVGFHESSQGRVDYNPSYPDTTVEDPDFDQESQYDETRDFPGTDLTDTVTSHEGCVNAVYDDVYVPSRDSLTEEPAEMGATASQSGDKAPRLPNRVHPQRSHLRRGGHHRNTYENVLLHNLTESLKRKLLPRKFSNRHKRESAREKKRRLQNQKVVAADSAAVESSRDWPSSVGNGSTSHNSRATPNGNLHRGHETPHGATSINVSQTEVEVRQFETTIENQASPEYATVARQSDALDVLENELYKGKKSSDVEFARTEL